MNRHDQNASDWNGCVNLSPRQLEQTWRKYRGTGGLNLRNVLAEHYLGFAKAQSIRLCERLPGEVDVDDVIAWGVKGLLDAVKGFDPDRGHQFETYCAQRVRGAILDGLRSADWVPRLVRTHASRLARKFEELQSELCRPPTSSEMAQRLGVSLADYEVLDCEACIPPPLSLDQDIPAFRSSRDVREKEILPDPAAESPDQGLRREDLKRFVTGACSKRERLILLLYYYEGLTMKEVGAALGMSESRISQIHAGLLERLRYEFEGRLHNFLPLDG